MKTNLKKAVRDMDRAEDYRIGKTVRGDEIRAARLARKALRQFKQLARGKQAGHEIAARWAAILVANNEVVAGGKPTAASLAAARPFFKLAVLGGSQAAAHDWACYEFWYGRGEKVAKEIDLRGLMLARTQHEDRVGYQLFWNIWYGEPMPGGPIEELA